MTRAGGIDLPGSIAGWVALDEIVIQAWDVARATGQELSCDSQTLAACVEWLEPMAEPEPEAREGARSPSAGGPEWPATRRVPRVSASRKPER